MPAFNQWPPHSTWLNSQVYESSSSVASSDPNTDWTQSFFPTLFLSSDNDLSWMRAFSFGVNPPVFLPLHNGRLFRDRLCSKMGSSMMGWSRWGELEITSLISWSCRMERIFRWVSGWIIQFRDCDGLDWSLLPIFQVLIRKLWKERVPKVLRESIQGETLTSTYRNNSEYWFGFFP